MDVCGCIQILRKTALKMVTEDIQELTISPDNLQQYVGKPKFTTERMYASTPPGVVTGLAWTGMGTSPVYMYY